MKQSIHKIVSPLVAFLVLFSTLSFTVDKHYCGDRLVEVSIFSELDGCGVDEDLEIEKIDKEVISFSKIPCCKNETSMIEGNSIDQQAVQKLKIEQVNFVTAFVISYANLLVINNSQVSTGFLYKPPLLEKEITTLFENFRI